MGYTCIVECIDGSFWPHSDSWSINSSDRSLTKSVRQ